MMEAAHAARTRLSPDHIPPHLAGYTVVLSGSTPASVIIGEGVLFNVPGHDILVQEESVPNTWTQLDRHRPSGSLGCGITEGHVKQRKPRPAIIDKRKYTRA
ncbi:hypothetical protein FOZ63_018397 [Perkinsus olseni]|uniref:Uncharacterized protein n=1 Tax=Perkinsus olseni TaxID=32597 RepID=A0A7J6SA37_PEROL|nr:hypothetical protein FOZ63_018397 [Perkinsus olseni]